MCVCVWVRCCFAARILHPPFPLSATVHVIRVRAQKRFVCVCVSVRCAAELNEEQQLREHARTHVYVCFVCADCGCEGVWWRRRQRVGTDPHPRTTQHNTHTEIYGIVSYIDVMAQRRIKHVRSAAPERAPGTSKPKAISRHCCVPDAVCVCVLWSPLLGAHMCVSVRFCANFRRATRSGCIFVLMLSLSLKMHKTKTIY